MTTSFLRPLPSAALLCALLPLAGCALLPSAGPDQRDIRAQHQATPPAFELIDLSDAALQAETLRSPPGFASQFGTAAQPPARRLGVGDGVTVEIWEAGTDTLFSARSPGASGGARSASLGEQLVDADGSIRLPFAGRVPVAGLSAIEAEQKITEALAGKASRPQVVVQLRNLSAAVTVMGDVAAGSRVPLTARGERVLDVLAAAGGVRAPSHETRIQLTREGHSVAQPLLHLLQTPSENIYVQAGDLLVATRQPLSFTAFGATGRNAQIEFGAEHVSLIEAVAKTGGLLDNRADPRGVYLFRTEPRALVASLQGRPADTATAGDDVRVVYRLDLSQASSYFIAQQFPMRDRDIVYVSNAATGELQKFLELVGLVSQPVIQGVVIRGALK